MIFLRILKCSSTFIQDFLDHLVLINVWSMMYMSELMMFYFSLSFYPIDFKPWHYEP